MKSPPSRRRPKSTTPEPTSEQNKSVEVVNHVQAIPEAIPEETDEKIKEEKNNSTSKSESQENSKKATPCENGMSSEIPHVEQKPEHSSGTSNGKRKDKHKKTINGLVRSVRSPETVSKDPEDIKDACSEPKKIKLEQEPTLQDTEVENLLKDSTLGTTPTLSPQTQGTPTAMETVSNSSSSEDTKPDLATDSVASTSAQCSDSGEKPNGTVENSAGIDSQQKNSEHDKKDKDSKPEKKTSEQHHRKHKKRKERKKHRHASGNDSTGSDAPGSPMYNQSAGVFSSPRRPRMSFDMDLGKMKQKLKFQYSPVKYIIWVM